MEVNDLREMSIIMYSLNKAKMNQGYKFYYDETNNVKKLILKEHTLNNQVNKHFVLGGIVMNNDTLQTDDSIFNELKSKCNLQDNINEIKSHHIYNGLFEDCLKSKKLTVILEWLLENQIPIHFTRVNLFYYGIVDIIDSICTDDSFKKYDTRFLKNELYTLAKKDISGLINLMYRYNYPNIIDSDVSSFLTEILSFTILNDPNSENLIELFTSALNLKELVFIQDNQDKILYEDLQQFYNYPIYMYINSEHIFDNESDVENRFKDIIFTNNGTELKNYKFVDSKSDIFIQISDVIVGLISKYAEFIDSRDSLDKWFDNLSNDRKLGQIMKNNMILICKLLKFSEECNLAFMHNIICIDEYIKFYQLNNHILKGTINPLAGAVL